MAITNEFMEAVQSGKMMRVRIMLKDSLLVDPTAAQFDEMERCATEKMGNIYTDHDGEVLNFDVSSWNEDYLNQQMVTVVNCFSKERIDLLKSMVRFFIKKRQIKSVLRQIMLHIKATSLRSRLEWASPPLVPYQQLQASALLMPF